MDSVDAAVETRCICRVLPPDRFTISEILICRLMAQDVPGSGACVALYCGRNVFPKPAATVVETTDHLSAIVLPGVEARHQRRICHTTPSCVHSTTTAHNQTKMDAAAAAAGLSKKKYVCVVIIVNAYIL